MIEFFIYISKVFSSNLCGEYYELSNGKPYSKISLRTDESLHPFQVTLNMVDAECRLKRYRTIQYVLFKKWHSSHSQEAYSRSDSQCSLSKRSKAVINEAYFRTPSTTDYNGVYNGYYIDFEAKETKNKTSFPLNNIHAHQVEHMKNTYLQKGIVFLMIRFKTLDEVYILPYSKFEFSGKDILKKSKNRLQLKKFGKMVTIFLININQD